MTDRNIFRTIKNFIAGGDYPNCSREFLIGERYRLKTHLALLFTMDFRSVYVCYLFHLSRLVLPPSLAFFHTTPTPPR